MKSLKFELRKQGQSRPGSSNQSGLCASSVSEARELSSEFLSGSSPANSGILLGRKQNNHYRLSGHEMHLLHEQYPTAEKIEADCFRFSHLWKPSANRDGIVYRAGETVIIRDDNEIHDQENVVCVDTFICAVVDNNNNNNNNKLYSSVIKTLAWCC